MAQVSRISDQFNAPSWQKWLSDLPAVCNAATPEQFLTGGRNELIRVSFQGKQLVVKRFRNRGLWKKFAYRISSSKARRSFEHSARIIEAGLLSPEPIAWLEVWRGPWLHESFYVSEHLDFAHDAYALKDPSLPDRLEKAALTGKVCAQLHEAGIAHLDLNSGNILFSQGPSGHWHLHIIDNNRMRFGTVSQRLARSLLVRTEFDGEILDAMLTSYARTRNYPAESFRNRYLSGRTRFELDRRIRDATRPWRKRVGL